LLTALRSTDDLVPYAIEVDELPPAMRDELADSVGLSPSERSTKRLKAALGDREKVRTLLRSFPGYALLVLEAICVNAGTILRTELAEAMKARRMDPRVVPMAVDFLAGHLLVVQTRRGRSEEITLVAPRARAIAELVLGIGVPVEVPPEPARDRDVLDDERTLLAITTLAAHRKLKLTREGLPNKTSLKTFARGLGLDDAHVERFLHRAFRSLLLDETSDGTIRPNARRARRAAKSGPPHPRESLLGKVSAALPDKGWVAAAALLPQLRVFAVHSSEDVRARCTGQFVVREHRGEWFVARAERPAERTGDGHVTPSFEVMLGPEAHPDIVVVVGCFAELVRLDRVLTFKITEASVLAGLRSGLSLDDFLSALSAVGRHGVPDNVALTVQDFAARAARVRPVWAIEVPVTAADAVIGEFGPAIAGVPKPGLLLVSADVSEQDVVLALHRAGVRTSTLVENTIGGEEHADLVPGPPPHPTDPDNVLREVVARERNHDFADSVRVFESAFPRPWRAEAPPRAPSEDDGPDAFSRRIEPGADFERHLRRLIEAGAVANVAVRSKGPELEVRLIAPIEVIRRGNEATLLAEDVDTEGALALPFSKIRWIEVDADEVDADEVDEDDHPQEADVPSSPGASRTVGRNDPCPCGSGKKYKRCHALQ